MKYAINVTLKAVYYNRKNRLLRLLYQLETGARPLNRTELRADNSAVIFWGVKYLESLNELLTNGEKVNALLLRQEGQKTTTRLLVTLYNNYLSRYNELKKSPYFKELIKKIGLDA